MCPASINGVVGLKPTVGLWSRAGIIPISHSQDSAGPMTRTVRDAAIALGAVVRRRSARRRHRGQRREVPRRLHPFLDPAGLKGARLGIVRNIPRFDAPVVALFERAIADLRAAGAVIVDPANLPNLDTGSVFQELPMVVLNYEFKANINRYLATLGPTARVKSLAELIAFNEAHRDQEMPFFGQERLVDLGGHDVTRRARVPRRRSRPSSGRRAPTASTR